MKLQNKSFCIFGLKGSGKTVLMNYILSLFKNHLVVTPHKEDYVGRNRYLATYTQYSGAAIEEINLVINKVVKLKKPTVFAIDEIGTWAPSMRPMPKGIADLCDNNRHYGIAFGCIDRRPTKINTNLVETADLLFLFRMTGKNDYQYLESIVEGLGDAVRSVPQYHFILVDENRDFKVMNPVRTV